MVGGLFGAFAGGADGSPRLRAYVFGMMCIAFGAGAAIGALVTESKRDCSLAVPVALLAIVLTRFALGVGRTGKGP